MDTNHSTTFIFLLVAYYQLKVYVDKSGYSSNRKIAPAELLPLMAKWTLPYSKPVNRSLQQICKTKINKNFLSPIQSWSGQISGVYQARDQLGTQEAKSFLRGNQILKLCPTHLPGGLHPPGYGPGVY